jgi:radical SAM/Cys-rich protein
MSKPELTLLRRASPLAETAEQRRILAAAEPDRGFARVLGEHSPEPLAAVGFDVLQINVGKLCNQTCRHCHVDAGPERREVMSREVAAACLEVLRRGKIPTLDITGGAPEMNPHFTWLVTEARSLGCRVIDRCNLTILLAPGFEHLPEFLAAQQVEIVASLPCYLEENVDRQRGDQVFERSVAALRRLNALGYGQPGSPLLLTLVFNPLGPSLPPDQTQLEADYRRELKSRYEIEFTRLFTITNLPISRFLDDLLARGQFDSYLHKLVEAFNPATVPGLMCRTMLSVDWQGRLSDCDFNQMLDLPLATGMPRNVRELDDAALARIAKRPIVTGQHCFGCTAGAGSSCQGSLAGERV